MKAELGSEKLINIIYFHAIIALGCGVASSFNTEIGLESLAITIISLWVMFFRINIAIGLKVTKTFLKTLTAAILSSIFWLIITIISGTILLIISDYLPIIGGTVSIMLGALIDFSIGIICGLIYLKLLTKLLSEDASEPI